MPARTLPVNVTAAMRGSAMAVETPSWVTLITSNRPSANPAFWNAAFIR